MTHLTEDERLGLIEAAEAPTHPHLAACASCRAGVDRARGVLQEARAVEVPEPSPLFWDSLSRRVSEEIARAGSRQPVRRWPLWRALIPLTVGVVALLVAVAVDRGSRSVPAGPAPAAGSEQGTVASALEPQDEQWMLLADLAADFDVETLSDSLGGAAAGGADLAVWQLNERERAELAVLLRAELPQRP